MAYEIGNKSIQWVIEDFQNSGSAERESILDAFCAYLWRIEPRVRTGIKEVTFEVSPDMPPDLAAIFQRYSRIRYMSGCCEKEPEDSFAFLKQSINYTYNKYCDPDVLCVTREVSRRLRFFRNLHRDVLSGKETPSFPAISAKLEYGLQRLDRSLRKAEARKLRMSWAEYQDFVREQLRTAFSRYRPPESCYESAQRHELRRNLYTYVTTSNYAVKYIAKTTRMSLLHQQQINLGKTNWRANYVPCPTCGYGYVETGSAVTHCPLCGRKPLRKSICENCGLLYSLPSRGRRSTLCPTCYEDYRRSVKRGAEKARRSRMRGQK